jgi:hypothetical protein
VNKANKNPAGRNHPTKIAGKSGRLRQSRWSGAINLSAEHDAEAMD